MFTPVAGAARPSVKVAAGQSGVTTASRCPPLFVRGRTTPAVGLPLFTDQVPSAGVSTEFGRYETRLLGC
jgi:hypothetical protein